MMFLIKRKKKVKAQCCQLVTTISFANDDTYEMVGLICAVNPLISWLIWLVAHYLEY